MTRTPRVVVDASALLDALSATGAAGDRAREALSGRRWAAPEHLRVEVFHGIRGRCLAGKLDARAGHRAVARLGRVAVEVVPTSVLLSRMWQLRQNLSGYDSAYMAAAEHLDVPLVTGDRRLAAAPGARCAVVVVSQA